MNARNSTPLVKVRPLLSALLKTSPSNPATDVALVVVRIVLAWIFTYYGAGKLFGLFNGPGIHRTASSSLRPLTFIPESSSLSLEESLSSEGRSRS